MSNNSRQNLGFTLVELLVVVMILAVLTNTVLFGLERVLGQKSETTVQNINVWLMEAQLNAAMLGTDLGIIIDEEALSVVAKFEGDWRPLQNLEPFRLSGQAKFLLSQEPGSQGQRRLINVLGTGSLQKIGSLSINDGERIIEIW